MPRSQTTATEIQNTNGGAFVFESNDPGTVQNAMRHGWRQVRERRGRKYVVAGDIGENWLRCGECGQVIGNGCPLVGGDRRAVDGLNVAHARSRLNVDAAERCRRCGRLSNCLRLATWAGRVLIRRV
jgi:hypothetical protein